MEANWTRNHEVAGSTPAFAQWIKDRPHCSELWYRLHIWLRSGVAVAMAVAGRCSSDSSPSLGTSICHRFGPKKQKKKKKKEKKKKKKKEKEKEEKEKEKEKKKERRRRRRREGEEEGDEEEEDGDEEEEDGDEEAE